jgi:hypothetical protein
MPMRIFGRSSLHEFLGEFVVYRNLVPADRRLPALADLRAAVGLGAGVVPRKVDPAYGAVMAHLLREARALTAPGAAIERIVYLGDTRMLDGTAFAHVCQAGGWPGVAFIGADRIAPQQIDVIEEGSTTLFVANRWTALREFEAFCNARGFPLDQQTAVVVDVDKTAIGARGRNDATIDQARVEAIRRTVGSILGPEFDPQRFQTAYDRLNQPEFHPFTADNQDYLAYICLVLGSGLVSLDALVARVRAGEMSSFEQFIREVDRKADSLADGLRTIHREILSYVQRGDPTPFKAFRRTEYRTTIGRMGHLGDDICVDELLRQEIVITHEVREAAVRWKGRGCLLFGLSDKPDEASIPTDELAAAGWQPLHRAETHVVGEV